MARRVYGVTSIGEQAAREKRLAEVVSLDYYARVCRLLSDINRGNKGQCDTKVKSFQNLMHIGNKSTEELRRMAAKKLAQRSF